MSGRLHTHLWPGLCDLGSRWVRFACSLRPHVFSHRVRPCHGRKLDVRGNSMGDEGTKVGRARDRTALRRLSTRRLNHKNKHVNRIRQVLVADMCILSRHLDL